MLHERLGLILIFKFIYEIQREAGIKARNWKRGWKSGTGTENERLKARIFRFINVRTRRKNKTGSISKTENISGTNLPCVALQDMPGRR